MATFYLIRHAHNDYVDKAIAGWTPGVSLNAEGREQAGRLAWKLLGCGITRLYSSPLERALQTAGPIAEALGLKVEVRDALGEIRFGEWTGKRLEDLDRDPRWRLFHQYRSGTRPPGGESYAQVAARLEDWIASLDSDTFAVSHGATTRILRGLLLGLDAAAMSALDEPQGVVFRVRGREVVQLPVTGAALSNPRPMG